LTNFEYFRVWRNCQSQWEEPSLARNIQLFSASDSRHHDAEPLRFLPIPHCQRCLATLTATLFDRPLPELACSQARLSTTIGSGDSEHGAQRQLEPGYHCFWDSRVKTAHDRDSEVINMEFPTPLSVQVRRARQTLAVALWPRTNAGQTAQFHRRMLRSLPVCVGGAELRWQLSGSRLTPAAASKQHGAETCTLE
jgi:hypothetical protein